VGIVGNLIVQHLVALGFLGSPSVQCGPLFKHRKLIKLFAVLNPLAEDFINTSGDASAILIISIRAIKTLLHTWYAKSTARLSLPNITENDGSSSIKNLSLAFGNLAYQSRKGWLIPLHDRNTTEES
jgi:hypothetical protein